MKRNEVENFDISELRKITKLDFSPAKLSAACGEGVVNGILKEIENYTSDGKWKQTKRYHIL